MSSTIGSKRKWDEPAEGSSKAVKTEGSGSPAGDVKPSTTDEKSALDAAGELWRLAGVAVAGQARAGPFALGGVREEGARRGRRRARRQPGPDTRVAQVHPECSQDEDAFGLGPIADSTSPPRQLKSPLALPLNTPSQRRPTRPTSPVLASLTTPSTCSTLSRSLLALTLRRASGSSRTLRSTTSATATCSPRAPPSNRYVMNESGGWGGGGEARRGHPA